MRVAVLLAKARARQKWTYVALGGHHVVPSLARGAREARFWPRIASVSFGLAVKAVKRLLNL